MSGGWVKFHRKITKWEWYDDVNTFKLFFHLVITANHKDKKWRGILVEKGSLISSISHLSKETGLSVSQVRTSIKKLILTNNIASESQTQYTIFTVLRYDVYQMLTSELANGSQTSDKRVTTNKNVKNVKNDKEVKKEKFLDLVFLTKEEHEKLKKKFGSKIHELIDDLNTYGYKIGVKKFQKKYASHYHTILSWNKDKVLTNKVDNDEIIRKAIEREEREEKEL